MEGGQKQDRIAWARETERLRWAVRVRWAVIGGFLGIAAALRPLGLFPDGWALVASAAVGALSNGLNHWSVERGRGVVAATVLAVSLDIVLITFVSASSGGLSSPLTIMYSVQVVATAMLVSALAAAASAGLAALGAAALALAGELGWLDPSLLYNAGLQADPSRVARVGALAWVACLSYGLGLLVFVGGFVSQRLRRSERRLERQNRRLSATVESLRRARDDLGRVCQQLQQAEAQLVHHEKMRALGQLVAGVAHELNNPISFVSSNIDHLRRCFRDLSECLRGDRLAMVDRGPLLEALSDVPEALEDCAEGARRAKRIVADLKTFSRADASEDWGPIDITDAAGRAIRILRHRFRGDLRLKSDLPPVPAVRGIAGQLEQVFVNLIANAIEALGDRGCVQVAATHDRTTAEVVVRVSDDGPGIAPENLDRVFEPFFTTKPVGQGTGIGLSLSYAIAQRHSGSLGLSSRPGAGATFELRLPALSEDPDGLIQGSIDGSSASRVIE